MKNNQAAGTWLKENWFISTKRLRAPVFLKGNIRQRERERENSWDKKHLGLSWVLLNTWKLILAYSVAAGLSAKPSLQEGVTSLDDLKDNRACWFLYNVHTWTGNRLLSSAQPPQLHFFWAAAILTLTQPARIHFLKLLQQHMRQELLHSFPKTRLISSREFSAS